MKKAIQLAICAAAMLAGFVSAGNAQTHQMNMSDSSMAMPMDMEPSMPAEDPLQAIPATLKTMFDRPDKPLTVGPVVVQGNWAIAGWKQDERGGRALLKKGPRGWRLHLCSGDGIRDAVSLEKIGLPADDAKALSVSLHDEEAKLDPATISLFASFEGTVVMREEAESEAGHAGHAGHAQ